MGHLTGCGALNLEPSIAADIQDGFLNWVRDCLNLKFKNVEEGEQFDIKIPDCDIKQESVIEKTKSQINENCKFINASEVDYWTNCPELFKK